MHAPEVQSTRRRDLRRVQLARTTSEWTFFHKGFYINKVGPMSTDIQSDFSYVSALDFAHELRGRSDRECQDLRLGRLGVPRPARICGSADSVSRDLPGLRIRLTAVPCILPERLESTWCHRDLPADQADHSPLISPVCGSGSLRDARDLPGELTDMTGAVEVRRIHHRAIPSFRATKSGRDL
ncbi:F-box family protein with DUF295 [Prunus dulcis]|uniref:F-box family protein with DUF295 n=1 Tax=Prunus dulcis TaxID=3755 RepID=A0A5H2XVM4_PRUDU|nr:F-box family protein with DUF295 [Prunus dulcis]